MNLPEGVFDRPRQGILIAENQWAIIRIETSPLYPANIKYKIRNRHYGETITPYLKGDWDEFDRLFGLNPKRVIQVQGQQRESDVVYCFAEHHVNPAESNAQKLPNITVVPNIQTTNAQGLNSPWTVFGCTMGHYHQPTGRGYHILEIYEFQTYGMLILDRGIGEVELWVAQAGDKVAIPSECHMTLYNIGDSNHPLITLDFAAPDHKPDKELVRNCGPIMLAYYNDFEVIFTLNWLYINNPQHNAGVRLSNPPRMPEGRQVRISRGARLELGRLLYEQLTQNPDLIGKFARLGIRIRHASSEAVLEPIPDSAGLRLYFCQPLVKATKKGTEVYRYFFPTSERAEPPPAPAWKETGATAEQQTYPDEKILKKEKHEVEASFSYRHLLIVVEGSGDWVEQTYRPLFKKKFDEYKNRTDKNTTFSVFYADDTRWKPKPDWADPKRWTNPLEWANPATTGLQPWEVYLDKADPDEYAQYLNLRPDAVFIVTPDFTHCVLAREWLGKTPTIFIEKPFDSQVTNVENMLLTLGQQQKAVGSTEILGLDHYQFYALPVDKQEALINEHLGGYIANVNFYLTEARPIEHGRVRSLQYGLTLDLLPHCIALLTYFGDVGSIDEIVIKAAGQYHPLVAVSRDGLSQESISDQFDSETYSHVQFTFLDHSGNDFRIPCRAIVGKGFSDEVKYMEVTGHNGNAIRIDLNRKPASANEDKYPWDSLFFLQGKQSTRLPQSEERSITDPYSLKQIRILHDPAAPHRLCLPLERSRYELLLKDLLEEESEAVRSTLTRIQGREIVLALDRIWWAIRESRPWKKYYLGKLNPLNPEDETSMFVESLR
jgi:predicted dehydrogenase/oxalate decarboxylase/phosphoglucose isomerase-like protein (cupin superfamily)